MNFVRMCQKINKGLPIIFTAGGITIVSVGRKCKLIRWPPGFKCVSAFLFAHVLMVGTNIGEFPAMVF